MNNYREFLPYAWMFGLDADLWGTYPTDLEMVETWSGEDRSYFEPGREDREVVPDLEATGRFYIRLALALALTIGTLVLLLFLIFS